MEKRTEQLVSTLELTKALGKTIEDNIQDMHEIYNNSRKLYKDGVFDSSYYLKIMDSIIAFQSITKEWLIMQNDLARECKEALLEEARKLPWDLDSKLSK